MRVHPSPVHPRASGERVASSPLAGSRTGSSPRERGTPHRYQPEASRRRFIPARAGNAVLAGENGPFPHGSSPRERGTRQGLGGLFQRDRFIPARAGNAFESASRISSNAVHPRASGERPVRPLVGLPRAGSSPRERGTPAPLCRFDFADRFIPARAGNAERWAASLCGRTVHPRASGERNNGQDRERHCVGSSPRERGTPARHTGPGQTSRFIPARAGNAGPTVPLRSCTPVHPRASGERVSLPEVSVCSIGSSPRERGTRRGVHTLV